MEKNTKKNKNTFQNIFPYLSLILILVIFTIMTKGALWQVKSLKSTLNDGIYVLMGTIVFTILCAMGMMDFSMGYNMGVSCAISCIAANQLGVWAAIPAAILTGCALGLLNGVVVTKTKVSSMIVTMGMMFILQGLVLVILNGAILQAPLAILGMYSMGLKLGLVIGSLVLGYLLLEMTTFGRVAKAIGACPEAVRQTGLDADKYRVIGYVITGLVCGILGFVSLARTGSATNSTGSSLLFNCMNATLLGAVPLTGGPTTKFRGAVIGALTISFLGTGMTMLRISSQNQQLIKGIIFLVAVGICFDRKNMKVIK